MGCFSVDFQEVKRPLRTKSVKRPIKVGKRPINEGKRPIKAKVLVGISVGCLMGCFRAPPPWRKTAPLKRPIKRSRNNVRAIRTNRLKPAIRKFLALRSAIRKNKRVQFGNPETIRENQVIRANLRIDSRESGHLSVSGPWVIIPKTYRFTSLARTSW